MWLFLICIIPNSKRHVKVTQRERERGTEIETEREPFGLSSPHTWGQLPWFPRSCCCCCANGRQAAGRRTAADGAAQVSKNALSHWSCPTPTCVISLLSSFSFYTHTHTHQASVWRVVCWLDLSGTWAFNVAASPQAEQQENKGARWQWQLQLLPSDLHVQVLQLKPNQLITLAWPSHGSDITPDLFIPHPWSFFCSVCPKPDTMITSFLVPGRMLVWFPPKTSLSPTHHPRWPVLSACWCRWSCGVFMKLKS